MTEPEMSDAEYELLGEISNDSVKLRGGKLHHIRDGQEEPFTESDLDTFTSLHQRGWVALDHRAKRAALTRTGASSYVVKWRRRG